MYRRQFLQTKAVLSCYKLVFQCVAMATKHLHLLCCSQLYCTGQCTVHRQVETQWLHKVELNSKVMWFIQYFGVCMGSKSELVFYCCFRRCY